ncbi:hypothetical protein G3N61_28620 [Burkholderia sp. Ac-20349]|uniref:Uncharacterized protein n=1 Tax=Burkholderia aenigmatica TaxID=2015348 RepID=A0A228IMZ1_9BURK|nr:hypothetical protein [Burkholderia sp. Ac-20349]OXI43751.1 hypothetical protein CFB84_19580 [Burkholderia aenigmatica]
MKRGHVTLAVAGRLVALPIAADALVQPLRVAAPAPVPGVSCPSADICIDDPPKLADARQRYRAPYAHAAAAVGPVQTPPCLEFCSPSRAPMRSTLARAPR